MSKRISKLSPQILEEASIWFIEFNGGEVDAAGREEFNGWLRASPEHVRAYLQLSAFWEDAADFNKKSKADVEELLRRATTEQNVVALNLTASQAAPREVGAPPQLNAPSHSTDAGRIRDSSAGLKSDPRSRKKSRIVSWRLAAGVLLAGGAGLFAWYSSQRQPVYAAEIGEQRSITLEDGSRIELNSRSRVKVSFTETERSIELLEGQALFRVAKNPSRPFIVHSDGASVRAVGTEFDVYRKSSGTVVTVISGRVAVASQQLKFPAADETYLSAGEQSIVTSSTVAQPKPANLATAISWTEKKLVFDSTPLREVVQEFNRYNRRQLVLRDPELESFHVSGVFPSTDPERVVDFLRRRFGVTPERSGNEIMIALDRGDAAAGRHTNIF